ncbi:sigma 54-interacting transcriptional regulator [Myxococcota bacterium]|nr:sigma 54-interacting transcriptional regulator [Myxococcota bacterium]MBU1380874.1 sigma 54-interacting transcriptional regulator [Myxococcota bacterium]MBU1498614.1 sigma 54-interacting transcriptional regulator [Myxococcota bacterium]
MSETQKAIWLKKLQDIISLGVSSDSSEDFYIQILVIIMEATGADRIAITIPGGDGENHITCARDSRGNVSPEMKEEISRSIISRASEEMTMLVFHPDGSGDFSESMKLCSIFTAVAVPILVKNRRNSGVLYADYRSLKTIVTPEHMEFLTACAGVISLEYSRHMVCLPENSRSLSPIKIRLEHLLTPESLGSVRDRVYSAISGKLPVLITGESGTGKTLLATAIAEASGKSPVVRATLGLSDDLNTIASELFGHLKGSFSGAFSNRTGLVERADGGMIILDEILNLPLAAQQLLLDFTQFGTYRPLGWDKKEPKKSSASIICVTNGNLEEAVKAGRFRTDLFYRIAGVRIEIPPLRERLQDIPALAQGFLKRNFPERPWTLHIDLRKELISNRRTWPGNVRQLESELSMACDQALREDQDACVLMVNHFKKPRTSFPDPIAEVVLPDPSIVPVNTGADALKTFKLNLEAYEKKLILKALSETGNVVAHAAKLMDIPRTTLISRMQYFRIDKS